MVRKKDRIGVGTLSYGYVLYPKFLKGFSRIVLRTGVLAGTQSIPDKFERISDAQPFTNNYTYRYDRHFTMAWLLSPSLDIALGRYAGLTIGPYGVTSSDFAGGGISFGVMPGRAGEMKMYEAPPKAKAVKEE